MKKMIFLLALSANTMAINSSDVTFDHIEVISKRDINKISGVTNNKQFQTITKKDNIIIVETLLFSNNIDNIIKNIFNYPGLKSVIIKKQNHFYGNIKVIVEREIIN